MVADRAHSDQPGDHNWQEAQPSELAIDPLMGAEPEEADKEEADAAEHPDPRDDLAESAVDDVVALLTSTSNIKKWIDLQPRVARHRSIDDWTRPWGPEEETLIDEEFH